MKVCLESERGDLNVESAKGDLLQRGGLMFAGYCLCAWPHTWCTQAAPGCFLDWGALPPPPTVAVT